MTSYPFHALHIPADVTAPVELVIIDSRQLIIDWLGGPFEATRYDLDSRMLVNDTGRIDGLPMNMRATHYLKTASAAAAQNPRLRNDDDPTYGLYGEVIAIGPDLGEDVPSRLVRWFEENTDTEWMRPPRTGPGYCPRCGSHSPHLHPAVQHEGEVETCLAEFHGAFRPREGESLADMTRRLQGGQPL